MVAGGARGGATPRDAQRDRLNQRFAAHGYPIQVLRRLGEGGMGETWEAVDLDRTDRPIALKVVSDLLLQRVHAIAGGSDARRERELSEVYDRFRREADAAMRAAERSVHIVHIYRHGFHPPERGGAGEALIFYTMELMTEGSLDGRLGLLDATDVRRVAREIAQGLTAIHESGIVHRDLTPDNVMFRPEGYGHIAKIGDFGIAKFLDESLELLPSTTEHGRRIGKWAWLPESEWDGRRNDPRIDLFSFGVVLYQMLAGYRNERYLDHLEGFGITGALHGREPTLSSYFQEATQTLEGTAPADLLDLVRRLTGVEGAPRLENARDLLAALGREDSAVPVRAAPPAPSSVGPWRAIAAVAALAIALVGGFAAWSWLGPGGRVRFEARPVPAVVQAPVEQPAPEGPEPEAASPPPPVVEVDPPPPAAAPKIDVERELRTVRAKLASGQPEALDEALRRLESIRRARPGDPRPAHLEWQARLARGNPQAAVEALETAVELAPSSIPYRMDLARTYARLGEPELARAVYLEIRRLDPTNEVARRALENG